MIRTIFVIGAMAMLGLFLLRIAFGLFIGLFALFFWLLMLALRVFMVGAIVYLILCLVAPATARRLRARFSGL